MQPTAQFCFPEWRSPLAGVPLVGARQYYRVDNSCSSAPGCGCAPPPTIYLLPHPDVPPWLSRPIVQLPVPPTLTPTRPRLD
jgi:hypothetical protein